jgi:hypothetical protein
MTVTKDLRFAMDEKGLKNLAPTLVGNRMSYWDNDRQLKHGIVRGADVARDRYGNPFIEVTLDETTEGESHQPAVVPQTGTPEAPPPFPQGGESAATTEATIDAADPGS